jgi:hypothetical protein
LVGIKIKNSPVGTLQIKNSLGRNNKNKELACRNIRNREFTCRNTQKYWKTKSWEVTSKALRSHWRCSNEMER